MNSLVFNSRPQPVRDVKVKGISLKERNEMIEYIQYAHQTCDEMVSITYLLQVIFVQSIGDVIKQKFEHQYGGIWSIAVKPLTLKYNSIKSLCLYIGDLFIVCFQPRGYSDYIVNPEFVLDVYSANMDTIQEKKIVEDVQILSKKYQKRVSFIFFLSFYYSKNRNCLKN